VDRFKPIWERRAVLAADPASLDRVVREGVERAQSVARETLASVNDAMHL
jgi:hypothetical protein